MLNLCRKQEAWKECNLLVSFYWSKKLRLFTSKYYNDKYKEVEEYISTTFYPYFNYNQTNTNLQNTLMLETPKDLTTTLWEKFQRGSRLIAEPDGNNVKYSLYNGQSAVLLPMFVMAEYGRHSETERVLVCNDRISHP